MITLAVYLVGSGLTALTLGNGTGWIVFLYATRFIAGMGIGGEYAAINSAIDELIPARYRGRVDIAVNGTYWGGAIIGTLGTLHPPQRHERPSVGWRIGFLLGPVLGLVILVRPAAPAGEPALAGHARPRARGRGVHQLHRARGRAARQDPAAGGREQGDRDPPATQHRLPGAAAGAVQGVPAAARSSAPR